MEYFDPGGRGREIEVGGKIRGGGEPELRRTTPSLDGKGRSLPASQRERPLNESGKANIDIDKSSDVESD